MRNLGFIALTIYSVVFFVGTMSPTYATESPKRTCETHLSSEPIEFVDYIFDRYAYLGMPNSATEDEIKKEIVKRKSQNHPDRMMKLGNDLRRAAEANWKIIEKVENVLLDDQLRKLFDERLKQFQDESPSLISKTGTAIISLERNFINTAYLLSGEESDLSDLHQQLSAMTGHKPKDFERAKRLYEKNVEDIDFKENYKSALEKKISFLEILEEYLWAAAGISGKAYTQFKDHIFDPSLIHEAVLSQIEHVRKNLIPTFIQERSHLLLTSAENPLLLLSYNSVEGKQDQALISDHLVDTVHNVQSRFTVLSEAIKSNAVERSQAIEDLLNLSTFKILHLDGAEKVTIYLLTNTDVEDPIESASVKAAGVFDGKFHLEPIKDDLKFGDLSNGNHKGTVAAVIMNQNFGEALLEIGNAYKRVQRTFGEEIELGALHRSKKN